MSKYTTRLRWIVEYYTPDDSDKSWTSRIKSACPKIFDFDFPIWSENYRLELESKIIRHYMMREIGQETLGLFKLELETRLNEIMPYYNQLYLTTVKDYDYMIDTDITEDSSSNQSENEGANYSEKTDRVGHRSDSNETNSTTDSSQNTTTDSETKDNSKTEATNNSSTTNIQNNATHNMHSDFPQSPIETTDYATWEEYQQNLIDNKTNGITTDSSSAENTGSLLGHNDTTAQTTLEESKKGNEFSTDDFNKSSTNNINRNKETGGKVHRKGASGSRSFTELLIQYRDSLINIDMMIIKDLSDLFMKVF